MKRFTWERLPEPARDAFEAEFGRVIATSTTPAGLTVGIASRISTERTTVFVKAVPRRSPAIGDYRRERVVLEALPAAVPAPQLLWVSDAGWLTLAVEHVEGRHADLSADATAVMGALALMRDVLTPTPVDVPRLTDDGEKLSAILAGAREAAEVPVAYRKVLDGADLSLFDGDALVHGDLVPSNLLVTEDGRVSVVDWAMAGRGPAWLDAALLITPLIAAGYSPADAEEWAAGHPEWSAAPPAALDALAVMQVVFFAEKAERGPEWLRDDRRASLWAHDAWARHRIGV
ncbi:phosphotransferase family protein [Nocardiopsis mangrovi]|uniref:Phosphotransferase family protein n=1 Tax=Nocardiopsis mangrovi TaxID=1179818 RepID=A0ABV9E1W3_9ACTN